MSRPSQSSIDPVDDGPPSGSPSVRERELEAIVANTPECVKIVARDGTILEMNPAGLRMIEADDECAAVGRSVFDVVHPEWIDEFRAMHDRVCNGASESLEFEIVGMRGARRTIASRAVPFRLPDGTIAQLAIARDVTREREQRRALEEAKTAAELANRTKNEFVANTSHEIRTPMTGMLGYAEILAGPLGEDEAFRVQAVEVIRSSCRHLLTLMNDILDVSMLEMGRVSIAPTTTPVRQLVEEVESLLAARHRTEGIELRTVFGEGLPESICTDPTRVKQVLINLVGNSIKFTREGEVRIEVRRASESAGDDAVEFAVVDTGVGIRPESLDAIFEPFAQVDGSITRSAGGVGLGLSIARGLVRELGGELTCTSEPGRGTTMRFSITGSPIPPPKATVEEDRSTNTDVHVEHVLVVDDDPVNRRLIAHILDGAGITSEYAENGVEAIEFLTARDAGRFDAVLMDMSMPNVDGYSATRVARESGYGGSIIALTANAMRGDRERCLESGCDGYLTKPYRAETLLAELGRTVEMLGG